MGALNSLETLSFVERAAGDAHAHGSAHSSAYCSSASCLRNWKIGFAVLLFVEGVLFGYVALALRRFACFSTVKFHKTVSLINVFGGGVFLATGLLHILPEAVEFLSGEGHSEHGHATVRAAGHGHGHDHANEKQNSTSTQVTAGASEAHAHPFPTAGLITIAVFLVFLFFDRVLFAHGLKSKNVSNAAAFSSTDEEEQALAPGESNLKGDIDEEDLEEEASYGVTSTQFVTASLMTAGIAVHSILESAAIGFSTSWGTLLNIAIAIAAHRWATVMALGARYARSRINVLGYSILIIAFSAVAPIGVAIGAGIDGASNVVRGVAFAISAGIFLYVGAFETPAEEFVEHPEMRAAKFALFALGNAVLAAITAILKATGVH